MVLDVLKDVVEEHALAIAQRLAGQHVVEVLVGHVVLLEAARNQAFCLF